MLYILVLLYCGNRHMTHDEFKAAHDIYQNPEYGKLVDRLNEGGLDSLHLFMNHFAGYALSEIENGIEITFHRPMQRLGVQITSDTDYVIFTERRTPLSAFDEIYKRLRDPFPPEANTQTK